MELSDNEVQQIKECLETVLDLSPGLPPYSIFDELVANGGPAEDEHSNYYGDDEAALCWALNHLCKVFNVEKDIIKRLGYERGDTSTTNSPL